jgi:hypothetical protein
VRLHGAYIQSLAALITALEEYEDAEETEVIPVGSLTIATRQDRDTPVGALIREKGCWNFEPASDTPATEPSGLRSAPTGDMPLTERHEIAIEALRDIASRPTEERNPDGDDQAAWSMQAIAQGALRLLGEPAKPDET